MITVLDFYAPWCQPCKQMEPIVESLEKQFHDVKFKKFNADEKGKLVQKYGIMSIPTYIIKKDGKEVQRFIGFTVRDRLEAALNASMA